MKTAPLLLAIMLAGGAASLARAQEGQSDLVAAGHDFALKVCAACHVVATDQISPPILKPPAPSFLALVRHGDVSEASLRKLLSTPHGNLGRSAQNAESTARRFSNRQSCRLSSQLEERQGLRQIGRRNRRCALDDRSFDQTAEAKPQAGARYIRFFQRDRHRGRSAGRRQERLAWRDVPGAHAEGHRRSQWLRDHRRGLSPCARRRRRLASAERDARRTRCFRCRRSGAPRRAGARDRLRRRPARRSRRANPRRRWRD